MDNVVESIFGLSPAQIQQRQNVGMMTAANNYASQDPLQRAAASMFAGGGMLAGAGAQAMGMVNPQMEQAKLTEAMMAQGGDLSTSQGLMAKSQQFAAAGDQRTALKLALAGKAKQVEEEKAKLAIRQENRKDYAAKPDLEKYAMVMAKRSGLVDGTPEFDDFVSTWMYEQKEKANKDKPSNMAQELIDAGYVKGTPAFATEMKKRIGAEDWKKGMGGSGAKTGTEMPDARLLQKDQRWVKKDGEWVAEVITGTKTDQKLRGDFSKDQDTVKTVEDSVKSTKEKIDFILSPTNKNGFKSNFGGYNAKFGTQYFSGNAAAVKQKIESLKSEMKAAGLAIMRSGGGVGQITEKEWKIMENMIDSIDPLMDEKDAEAVLKEVAVKMDQAESRAKSKFQSEWGGSKYGKGSSGNWSDL